ncbi:MAG TPA: 1-phosphofructokinase family hexose kinase [Chitinophagaceae bacterium]|nr:1-phosphofructokinase family hexose kinase [Chitinophagaceae bacterium]
MSTILTITFSPCVDKSFSIPELIPEKKLRTSIPKTEPGGGGINVARVLARLGTNAIALYPSGGYTGQALDELIAKEHIPAIPVKTRNETRENVIVLETSTNKQFRFTMPATSLSEKEIERLLESIEHVKKLDFIVVSGSLPAGIAPNIFSRIAIVGKKKAKLVVDTSGEGLKYAVDQGVYLIKPNISELAYLAGKEYLHTNEIVHHAKSIIKTKNCEIIVVSLNAAGAVLITKNATIAVTPPAVKVKSTVGAGDSMVAGMVFALSRGDDIETASQYGVACGTAATLNAGTELCHKKDVEVLFNQIRSLSNKPLLKS